MARFKVIDHSSAIDEIVSPFAKLARNLRAHAIVLDTETTDSSAECEVIEMGIVRASDGEVLFDSRFKPNRKIDYYARRTHGIKDGDLINEPSFASQWERIAAILAGQVVLAWGSAQDKRFIESTCSRYGLALPSFQWECLMHLYRQFKKLPSACKLSEACNAMGVKPGTHSAVSDALAAARVLYRMAQSAPQDEVVVYDNGGDDLDGDDMAMTVRDFLSSFSWQEERRIAGDSVMSFWIDPSSGTVMDLSKAVDTQRSRMRPRKER